jgi:NAD(P) transhydrogenase subunit beta
MSPATLGGVAVPLLYLLSAVLFIVGLQGLTRVRTARRGNAIAALAMFIAVATTLLELGVIDYRWLLVGLAVGGVAGLVAALRVEMTAMPEMVALFNGCGGGASALVAIAILWVDLVEPGTVGTVAAVLGGAAALTTFLTILVGAVTFSGSVIAFAKLHELVSGRPILLPGRHLINGLTFLVCVALGLPLAYGAASPGPVALLAVALLAASLVLGVLLVLPIGGADMPVVISLLNSLSGVAAATTGFVLANNLLIISGALVGASGLILTQIMCAAMNRSLGAVLVGGFGGEAAAEKGEYANVRSFSPEEAALVLEAAERVIIVPGYGLAVAQAQHVLRELAELLEAHGAEVTFAIHPVAGRMPGHMNVLLAEADVPYEKLVEMERVNPEFNDTDVVLVVGANDVVNPAAKNTPGSPIYGMPILEVYNATTVMVIKRSLSPGFAGIRNELFENDRTMMLFGDAKEVLQELLAELKQLTRAA